MTINTSLLLEWSMAAVIGIGLGSIYFGGLWLTVSRATRSRQPGPVMLASLFLRLALVGGGLYLLADGHWQRYIAALLGLLVARRWWVKRFEPRKMPS